MNNPSISIRDLFGLQELRLDESRLKAAVSGDVKQNIESALAKFPGVGWEPATDALREALAKTFDIGAMDLLVGVWSKWSELQKYVKEPETINYLRLASHTISSEHEPEIEFLLNDQSLGKLKFKATIELELSGANLMIHEAMIKKVTAVSGKGSFVIEYEDHELYERESKSFDMPGEVRFDPGISLAALNEKARRIEPAMV